MKTAREIRPEAAIGKDAAISKPIVALTANSSIVTREIWSRRPNCDMPGVRLVRNAIKNLVFAGVFLLIPLSAGLSEVQAGAPSLYPTASQNPFPDPFHGMDEISRQQFQKQLKALNVERQKQLASDSVKLLALATELKTEFDQAGDTDPTPDQLHKAEQIEKLAHSVRDKMKDVNTPAEPMQPMRRK